MATSTVRIYHEELHRIVNMPGGGVGKAMRQVALEIAEEARRQAIATFGLNPSDQARTGLLAESYQVKVVPGTNQFRVTNPKKYAAAMEEGARPHRIAARRVSYLRFRGRDGGWRKVKIVQHPGSVGRQTLRTAAHLVMMRRFGTG